MHSPQSSTNKRSKLYGQLEDILDPLRDKVEQLRSKKRSIEMSLMLEDSAYKRRTANVTQWLYYADKLGAEVDELIEAAEQELTERRNVLCCCWNRGSKSILGLKVYEKIQDINHALAEDDFDVMARPMVEMKPHYHVDLIHVEATVDFESNLDEVWRCLEDESLQIIGIFGMAGVGKTTLLKKIKDDLEKRRFDTPAVIWVSASKETHTDAIQDDIAKQLAVFRKKWKNAKNPADGERKFLLLFDDLWARLDLSTIVGPHLNGSDYKVVFTTRSEAVCDDMAADVKLKLKCLSQEEALKLFLMNVGDDVGNSFPQVQHLATHINESLCQGLPLAIVAVGRALAGMRNPHEELLGIKHVFHILEPSYDNLEDDMVRRLFLYCSILPGMIKKDELIRLWIGEGFVDISDKQRGEYFVEKLVKACLLESDIFNDYVGMHSVIRAFGLYLCRERDNTDRNFLVKEWKSENMNEAVRVSIDGEIDVAALPRLCPKLQTLFIRKKNLTTFPEEFFQSMHSLKVLNLSENDKLAELPSSIGILTNLHYLSLSFTSIKELPVEVKLLKELKVLLADYTENLKLIPEGVIPSLSSLKVFSKLGDEIYNDTMLLEELKSTEGVDEINVSLFTHEAATIFVHYPKLQQCIRKLTLKNIMNLKIPVTVLSGMVQLEDLVIDHCTDLQFEMSGTRYDVLSIQCLWIQNCKQIDNLRWLIFAPRLQVIDMRSCESLVEIIGSDFETEEIKEIDERLGIFSNLKKMRLEDLYSLQCICPQDLRFPALIDVYIAKCPKLSVLPFDPKDVLKKSGGEFLHLENNAGKVPDLQ